MFEIEWDYDYGFVLTSKDAGATWASHPSTRSVPTTTASPNPNQNGCMTDLGNGITGSSASYASDLDVQLDRATGAFPSPTFIADSFDISDLVGAEKPVLRFSYSSDPGLAKAGWFIDDLKVTATTPSGDEGPARQPTSRPTATPTDPRFFSGGCKEGWPSRPCTAGWQYVNAGAAAPFDHGYYMELRDRSGFDIDGFGPGRPWSGRLGGGLLRVVHRRVPRLRQRRRHRLPAQSPLDANPGGRGYYHARSQRRAAPRKSPAGHRTQRLVQRRRPATPLPRQLYVDDAVLWTRTSTTARRSRWWG